MRSARPAWPAWRASCSTASAPSGPTSTRLATWRARHRHRRRSRPGSWQAPSAAHRLRACPGSARIRRLTVLRTADRPSQVAPGCVPPAHAGTSSHCGTPADVACPWPPARPASIPEPPQPPVPARRRPPRRSPSNCRSSAAGRPGDGWEKRLHDRLQEQRPLGLITAGLQDHRAGRGRLRRLRLGQPCLADPGLPNNQDNPWLTTSCLHPRGSELGKLPGAADQPPQCPGCNQAPVQGACFRAGWATGLGQAAILRAWVSLAAGRKMARCSSWVSGAGSLPSSSASRLLSRA